MIIDISNSQSLLPIDPESFRDLARHVLEGEGVREANVSIAFVNDPKIHEINREHLAHDWPTDVITFRLSDPGEEVLEAELVVSAEMALNTAIEAGTRPSDELSLYVVHGLLHLCGHDDRTETDAAAMRLREDEILRREGIPNTFSKVGLAVPSSDQGGAPCPV